MLAHTAPARAPLVPELVLQLATEITPIWLATEAWLAERNVEPPFWAFAWPGGQALARALLDRPEHARGRRVLDFAAGGGIAAIAAALAGAARVEAAEIDPLALAAVAVNAAANGVMVEAAAGDMPGPMPAGDSSARNTPSRNTPAGTAPAGRPGDVVGSACRWDLILCGDVCYEAPMTAHILPWLRRMAAETEVWVADPGRAYLPAAGLSPIAAYDVPTTLELEDRTLRHTRVFRMQG